MVISLDTVNMPRYVQVYVAIFNMVQMAQCFVEVYSLC